MALNLQPFLDALGLGGGSIAKPAPAESSTLYPMNGNNPRGAALQPTRSSGMNMEDAGDPAQWQNEVMGQIDPATQKKRAIASGLVALSKTLGSTPGSFLTGLGQAAPAGAEALLETREKQRGQRVAGLKGIADHDTEAGDRKMKRLYDALGMGMDYNKYEQDSGNAKDRAAQATQRFEHERGKWVHESSEKARAIIQDERQTIGLDKEPTAEEWSVISGDPETLRAYQENRASKEKYIKDFEQQIFKQYGLDHLGRPRPQIKDGTTRTLKGKNYIYQGGEWYEQ